MAFRTEPTSTVPFVNKTGSTKARFPKAVYFQSKLPTTILPLRLEASILLEKSLPFPKEQSDEPASKQGLRACVRALYWKVMSRAVRGQRK